LNLLRDNTPQVKLGKGTSVRPWYEAPARFASAAPIPEEDDELPRRHRGGGGGGGVSGRSVPVHKRGGGGGDDADEDNNADTDSDAAMARALQTEEEAAAAAAKLRRRNNRHGRTYVAHHGILHYLDPRFVVRWRHMTWRASSAWPQAQESRRRRPKAPQIPR